MGGSTNSRNRNDSAKERGMSEREKGQRDRVYDRHEQEQKDIESVWG